MTYIIGTYIDEQDDSIFDEYNDWFNSLEKSIEIYPKLNGKVIEYVFEKNDIVVTLKRNKVHPTLAKKRIEIMQKRFGPFCGKEEIVLKNNVYKDINLVTIESIFSSIVDREHLGEEYININGLKSFLYNNGLVIPFLEEMINYSTARFEEIYSLTASRTKGKVRENLENYILGFDGSTIDATWFRVFNDSYNKIFTKEVKIKNGMVSLSSSFNLHGNEKIAFDELINTFFPYLFSKFCDDGQSLNYWYHEIDCRQCAEKENFKSNCIWGMFVNAIGYEEFTNRGYYDTVYKWLVSMHNFKHHCKDEFFEKFANHFYDKMIRFFIPLCREHNIEIAKKKIRKSDKAYQEAKHLVFCEYQKSYDAEMEVKDFFNLTN